MPVSMLAPGANEVMLMPKQASSHSCGRRPNSLTAAGLSVGTSGQRARLTSDSQVHLLRVAVLPEVCGELEHRHRRGLRDIAEDGHG